MAAAGRTRTKLWGRDLRICSWTPGFDVFRTLRADRRVELSNLPIVARPFQDFRLLNALRLPNGPPTFHPEPLRPPTSRFLLGATRDTNFDARFATQMEEKLPNSRPV